MTLRPAAGRAGRRCALPALALACGLAGFAGAPAHAQAARQVIVNGLRMSPAQLAQLDHLACAPVPNGRYWLNMQTGQWGHADDPRTRGVIGEACQQRRPSLSERRQLYRPGEILSGN